MSHGFFAIVRYSQVEWEKDPLSLTDILQVLGLLVANLSVEKLAISGESPRDGTRARARNRTA